MIDCKNRFNCIVFCNQIGINKKEKYVSARFKKNLYFILRKSDLFAKAFTIIPDKFSKSCNTTLIYPKPKIHPNPNGLFPEAIFFDFNSLCSLLHQILTIDTLVMMPKEGAGCAFNMSGGLFGYSVWFH